MYAVDGNHKGDDRTDIHRNCACESGRLRCYMWWGFVDGRGGIQDLAVQAAAQADERLTREYENFGR